MTCTWDPTVKDAEGKVVGDIVCTRRDCCKSWYIDPIDQKCRIIQGFPLDEPKLLLKNPVAVPGYLNNVEDHNPLNGIDGDSETFFALDTGKADGYFQADFAFKGTRVVQIRILTRPLVNRSQNAKIYIGDTLCGTLPKEVEKSKRYIYDCDATGDYVRVVTGRED